MIAAGPLTDELGPRTVWAIAGGLAASRRSSGFCSPAVSR